MKKFISVILALTLLVGMTQCFVSAEESFSDSTFLQNIELSGINYSENMLKTAKPDDIKIINFSLFFSPDSRLLDSVNQRTIFSFFRTWLHLLNRSQQSNQRQFLL